MTATSDMNTTIQELLEVVFSVGPCRGHIRRVCRQTDKSESEVAMRKLPLGGGVGGRGVPIVGSCCEAMPREDVE
jgi:hypothetical protein